ncbi:hypothetical protein, partial [Acetobacter persici]|uniref:hypothetical protein n=1 Tax=Acetobacter persici TaxID=1076596 RepID=UPI001F1F33C2
HYYLSTNLCTRFHFIHPFLSYVIFAPAPSYFAWVFLFMCGCFYSCARVFLFLLYFLSRAFGFVAPPFSLRAGGHHHNLTNQMETHMMNISNEKTPLFTSNDLKEVARYGGEAIATLGLLCATLFLIFTF